MRNSRDRILTSHAGSLPRLARFANLVGKERVIASTDCGLGGRVPPQIAWAKLEALAQGAALASA